MTVRRDSFKGLARTAGLFFLSLSVLSCATYQSKVGSARDDLMRGDSDRALAALKPLAEKVDGDQLVYLLDYATALQIAGQIDESTKEFLHADKLAEAQNYTSVTREAGALLTNEEMSQYKGDTFEKIFINAELAINYTQKGMIDDAIVECRRINEKFLLLRSEDKDKKKYSLNPFAKYLSAVLWESNKQYDDAAIAYEEAYNISPNIDGIKEDLIRSMKLARRTDAYQQYKKQFSDVAESPDWYDKNKGELIVIVQQGWGPRKEPDRLAPKYPALRSVPSRTQKVRAEIGSTDANSRIVYDVNTAAIKTLADDRASLIGRRLGGAAAKLVVADQIRQKSPLLGFLAEVGMFASDRADLRQWSTLPSTEQLIRIRLTPGNYKLNLQGTDWEGGLTPDKLSDRPVEIKANRKTFVVWRTLR